MTVVRRVPRAPRSPRTASPALSLLLLSLTTTSACDASQDAVDDRETALVVDSTAPTPNAKLGPPDPLVAPTIRFEGLLWLAPDGIVSTLPVFAVRYEIPLFETFQIVEQPDASCGIAPAAPWWNHPGDPDAYQTVTTGEGLRHFCAFARDASGASSGAPLAFTVTVDPAAPPPAPAVGHTLDKDPSPVALAGTTIGGVQAKLTYVGGFGMRNSGRVVPAAPLAPPPVDYASQIAIPPGWDTSTVSFMPPSGNPGDLVAWENFAIGYVKSATADENDVRMFGNDVAAHGFEPIVAGPNDPPGADLMTKIVSSGGHSDHHSRESPSQSRSSTTSVGNVIEIVSSRSGLGSGANTVGRPEAQTWVLGSRWWKPLASLPNVALSTPSGV